MIKSVVLGEEIIISTKNQVGLLADVTSVINDYGINIEAVMGYEVGNVAKLFLITNGNLVILSELRKKQYKSIEETEVIIVDIQNKQGVLKLLTTQLKKNDIDINYLFVTSCSCGGSSRMVIRTSDNEKAMSLLTRLMPSE